LARFAKKADFGSGSGKEEVRVIPNSTAWNGTENPFCSCRAT
jgi:hypothetical protein